MRRIRNVLLCLLAALLLVASACSKQKTEHNSSSKIKIVTSTNIYADMSKQLVGKYGSVTPLIANGDIDPHDFDPTTASAKEVAQADLVIANGSGYDSWMDHLAYSNDKHEIKVAQEIMHYKSDSNPHIWFDLQMPIKYANFLTKKLIKLQPQHKQYFLARKRAYLEKFKPIQQLAKSAPGKQQAVFVSEPVLDYALKRMGYRVDNKAFEDAIERETDPNPEVVEQMKSKIAHHKIAFFVNNTQASSSIVNTFLRLSKRHRIPIVNVRETKPNGVSYVAWLSATYKKLARFKK
ncbi:MAG: zinc ABC transporter substrate-binding protein [Lactobacillus sp.]|jgi:zinc/manganese transport system substrate-binding protein|nr:zinc ABC transporter substrate-binding protein [Lactobacillus sp.]